MDAITKLRAQQNAVAAALKNLSRHTVAIVSNIFSAATQIASGVLIRIGDRFLVATVAHANPNNPEGKLWILPMKRRRAEDGIPGFQNHGKELSGRPDVGFLELSPDVVPTHLEGVDPLPVERLGCPPDSSRLCLLLGCPAELMDRTAEASSQLASIRARTFGFATTILNESEYLGRLPSTALPPDKAVDVFLSYADDDDGVVRAVDEEPVILPNPSGMSGGGLWDISCEKDQVWHTERARLFALQTSKNPPSSTFKYVRAAKIHHWIKLVHRAYKDLRPTLEGHFPWLTTC